MSYTYEDYANWYGYYYGDYYAAAAAAAAAPQAAHAVPAAPAAVGYPPPAVATPPAAPIPAVHHAVAPPPTAATASHYASSYPTSSGAYHSVPPPTNSCPAAAASAAHSYVRYPTVTHAKAAGASAVASSGPTISGRLGGSKRAGLGAPPSVGPPKRPKKPPVPSVTCPICDITVSSEQVYETHINGKAHKKKAEKMGHKQTDVSKEEASAKTADVAVAGTKADAAIAPPVSSQQQQQPSTVKETSAAIITPGVNESPGSSSIKKQKNSRRKVRPALGSQAEQVIYQCELCNVTVNSRQQLDLHLTGIKHKKTVTKLSRSKDPEVIRRLAAAEQLAKEVKQHLHQTGAQTTAAISSCGEAITTAAADDDGDDDHGMNLPPGYVFIGAASAPNGKDTYLCSTCQHSSSDLFSLNAHVSSSEHKERSAKQEKPLESNTAGKAPTKVIGQKTNFNLGRQQTASGVRNWNANKIKRVVPLASSFVSGEVLK